MHYYGTYTLACAAGLAKKSAEIIATAAQFIDDNAANTGYDFDDKAGRIFEDGVARIDTVATAHHVMDRANLKPDDQRQVWVPFHFLPGNIGDSYTERLKCRMDSAIAREMVDHHLNLADRDYAEALIGVTAHVYADTFSHYGFSGVSSRGNKVENSKIRLHQEIDGSTDPLDPEVEKYIRKKMEKLLKSKSSGISLENIKAAIAEVGSGALGHGSVATYPDRPYLIWAFPYERPDAVSGINCYRNNPATFMLGAQALYAMFDRFRRARPDLDGGDRLEFEAIREVVKRTILKQGDCEARISEWRRAAEELNIGQIPDYKDEDSGNGWNQQWEELGDGNHTLSDAAQSPIWRFYQAASLHRTYVLRDLLPRHGLIVN
jgi:BMFP domain-containing protein YqiC